MDRSRQRALYNAFGGGPLAPNDPRWVDLDEARGVTVARDVVADIPLATSPVTRVIATTPGLGVTSVMEEIRFHLRSELETHVVDVASCLNLQEPVTEGRLL